MTGDILGNVDLLLGKSYSIPRPRYKSRELSQQFSNYKGRIEARPINGLVFHYQFFLNEKSVRPHLSILGGSMGSSVANVVIHYNLNYNDFGKNNKNLLNNNKKQINFFLNTQLTSHLSVTGSFLRALKQTHNNRGSLGYGVSSFYYNNKFTFGLTANHQSSTLNLRSSTIFMMTLNINQIKNLYRKP